MIINHTYKKVALKNSKQGYLLIEALCTLALLSILTLFATHAQMTVLFLQQDGVRRLAALSAAQNYIEQWLVTQDDSNLQVMGGSSKGNKITLESFLVPQDIPKFSLVKVKVTWQSCHGKAETIEVYAGRAHV